MIATMLSAKATILNLPKKEYDSGIVTVDYSAIMSSAMLVSASNAAIRITEIYYQYV